MGKTSKTTKKKPTEATKPTAAGTPVTRADKILTVLAARWPALTGGNEALFRAKYTDAKCEKLGADTRSEGVLGEALAFASVMDKALTAHPRELRRYDGQRFAWFLQCIGKLAQERALQEAGSSGPAAMAAARDRARTAALAGRTEVVDSLEELVEGDEVEEEALSAARGETSNPDRIVASIRSLCTYARGWLARPDQLSRDKVAMSGLTLAEVEHAEQAAATLVNAGAGKTLEGAVIVRDAPAVNRIEGRVLLEMRTALRVFNKAKAKNNLIPTLTPGDATRHVLLSRSGKVIEDGTPEDGAAPGAEGPPGEAGTPVEAGTPGTPAIVAAKAVVGAPAGKTKAKKAKKKAKR
jgi:hypothetical protein